MTRDEIIQAIHKERDRQDKLHPIWKGDQHGLVVLAEEFGEVAKSLYDLHDAFDSNKYDHLKPDDYSALMRRLQAELKSEIVQCASVCIRWLENR